MHKSRFQFSIEHVLYIIPPEDQFVVIGMVSEGSILPGDAAVVHCMKGPVSVVVECIETLVDEGMEMSEIIPQAVQGQEVGLRLRGITKDQARTLDHVAGLHSEG